MPLGAHGRRTDARVLTWEYSWGNLGTHMGYSHAGTLGIHRGTHHPRDGAQVKALTGGRGASFAFEAVGLAATHEQVRTARPARCRRTETLSAERGELLACRRCDGAPRRSNVRAEAARL